MKLKLVKKGKVCPECKVGRLEILRGQTFNDLEDKLHIQKNVWKCQTCKASFIEE